MEPSGIASNVGFGEETIFVRGHDNHFLLLLS